MYKIVFCEKLTVLRCWYRPTRKELQQISNDEVVRHVLGGGLLRGELGRVTPIIDKVDSNWKLCQLADYMEKEYGIRISKDPWFPIDREKLNDAN